MAIVQEVMGHYLSEDELSPGGEIKIREAADKAKTMVREAKRRGVERKRTREKERERTGETRVAQQTYAITRFVKNTCVALDHDLIYCRQAEKGITIRAFVHSYEHCIRISLFIFVRRHFCGEKFRWKSAKRKLGK